MLLSLRVSRYFSVWFLVQSWIHSTGLVDDWWGIITPLRCPTATSGVSIKQLPLTRILRHLFPPINELPLTLMLCSSLSLLPHEPQAVAAPAWWALPAFGQLSHTRAALEHQ